MNLTIKLEDIEDAVNMGIIPPPHVNTTRQAIPEFLQRLEGCLSCKQSLALAVAKA